MASSRGWCDESVEDEPGGWYSITYAANMLFPELTARFRSIKVKAYWFHVRERGVFGAIFGTLISFGVYFAFDWGGAIVNMTKANPTGSRLLHGLIRKIFATESQTVDATGGLFHSGGDHAFWAALDACSSRTRPEEGGFSAPRYRGCVIRQMHIELSMFDLLKKVFTSR